MWLSATWMDKAFSLLDSSVQIFTGTGSNLWPDLWCVAYRVPTPVMLARDAPKKSLSSIFRWPGEYASMFVRQTRYDKADNKKKNNDKNKDNYKGALWGTIFH